MRRPLPVIVDALLAGASLVAGLRTVQYLTRTTGYPLYDSKMLSSAIILCINPTPPTPRAFLVCTACALVAGVVLNSAGWHGDQAGPLAASFYLVLSKLSGHSFSATVGFAVAVASAPLGGPSGPSSWWYEPYHKLAIWIVGHATLYLFALAAAYPRRAARIRLSMRQWAMAARATWQNGANTLARSRLREIFNRYDTSGDGRIDAHELQVAMRALSGLDLAVAECEEVIRAFDADGNGTIDFDEFYDAASEFAGLPNSAKWMAPKVVKLTA